MARPRPRRVRSVDADIDYRTLAELRYQIRRFVRVRELAARTAGIEPRQYLLLLQVKALEGDKPATLSALAERLQISHHAVVQMVDRLVRRGLVRRHRADRDRRHVVIALRPRGATTVRKLAAYSIADLRAEGEAVIRSLKRLLGER